MSQDTLCGRGSEYLKWALKDREGRVRKTESLAISNASKAMYWPTSGFKKGTFDRPEISAEGTLISASAVPLKSGHGSVETQGGKNSFRSSATYWLKYVPHLKDPPGSIDNLKCWGTLGTETLPSGTKRKKTTTTKDIIHIKHCPKEKGVERGSSELAVLKGLERPIVILTCTKTVSKTLLTEDTSDRRGGAYMGFLECVDIILK